MRTKNLGEIERLYLRAIKLGRAKGLGDEAEDFASWLAIKWLEGKSQKQTLDQSLIDYKRKSLGHTRSKSAKAKFEAKHIPLHKIKL